MLQITPILGDNLSPVIQNVIPLIAQNLASKNNEIQDLASNILDIFVEYLGNCILKKKFNYFKKCFNLLDGGILIQPFSNLAQHGNTRIRPQIINKLAG